ncbi:MAG TPA: hypothetical protein VFQ43_20635 [Nitrososphaera sp.]|nr:MAG: hypothetical protein E6H20_10420 [Candidatus Bathyarchaeota archaeon]HEU0050008.1 hypothetical protein [Nitrososphaera sp.]
MGIFEFLKRGLSTQANAGTDAQTTPTKSQQQETSDDVTKTQRAILSFTLFGIVVTILFTVASISPFSWTQCAKVTGMGLLYAGAFFGIGALAGFLFGIPRSLQAKPKDKTAGGSTEATQGRYAANTNLEEISDWLTKIIVGLGLVNLKSVPEYLKRAAWYFANFCGKELCESVAMGVMIYFFVCGFFLGYLMTRLYLTGAFTRADKDGTVETIEAVQAPIEIPISVIPKA